MLKHRLSRMIVLVVVVALAAALMPALPRAAAAGEFIAYGDVVNGTITDKNYFEVWEFAGAKGDRVQVLMEGDGNLDPYLGLLNAATEQVLAEDDDSAGNSNAYIEITLPATGIYLIVATRYDFDLGLSQGQYALALAGGGGPTNVSTTTTAATATEPEEVSPGVFYMGDLALAEPVGGTITNNAYAHIYSVELQAGTELIIAMFADESTLDPYLIFANEAGDVLAEDDDSGVDIGGGPTDAFIHLTVKEAGIYLIAATRAGTDTGKSSGAYALIAGIPDETEAVEEQPASDELPPGLAYIGVIEAGTSVKNTIADDSFFHIYEFEGQAGDEITITMRGTGGLDAYIGLVDPNDDIIAEDDDSAGGTDAQIAITLPESGTYAIIATRNGIDAGTTTGNYTLEITVGPPPAPEEGTSTSIGGLPGRAFETDSGTFYLRGFGGSRQGDKCSSLLAFASMCEDDSLPGRGGAFSFHPVSITLNFEEIK